MRSQRVDPFDVAKDEVEAAVRKVQFMHKEWRRQLEQQNTAENQQFKDLHAEIKGELQLLDYDLQEVDRSITTVEQNRDKFHLSDEQLKARRAFVTRSQQAHREVEADLNGNKANAKMEEDRRQALLSSSKKEQQKQQQRSALEADAYFEQETLLQKRLVEQQEDELLQLSKATQRVGQVAVAINSELHDHQRMLDELNDDFDEQTQKMGALMKGVTGVLKTSNKCQIGGLAGLILLFVLLVWLIFNT